MTPSERATLVMNPISEGINCLAQMQSLRAQPPLMSSVDRDAWLETLADMQTSLQTVRTGHMEGHRLMTSMQPSDELMRSLESLRADLSAVPPGVQLPPSLFDLVDVAAAESAKSLTP